MPCLPDEAPDVGERYTLDCLRCGQPVTGPVVWVHRTPTVLPNGEAYIEFAVDVEHD